MKYVKNFETISERTAVLSNADDDILHYTDEDDKAGVYEYDPFNGHDYVDLGVTYNGNKLLFAKCNVGASTETGYGNYYAWGETTTKSDYSWSTYIFNPSGDGTTFTKYNSTDQKVILDPEDDPVCVNMGGQWRSPIDAELTALLNQTTNTMVSNYNGSGVNGRVFTGTNGNTMFVPAAGKLSGTYVSDVGSNAHWWSNSLYGVGSVSGRRLYFNNSSSICGVYNDNRYYGFAARGVVSVEN